MDVVNSGVCDRIEESEGEEAVYDGDYCGQEEQDRCDAAPYRVAVVGVCGIGDFCVFPNQNVAEAEAEVATSISPIVCILEECIVAAVDVALFEECLLGTSVLKGLFSTL